jgi:hypothetical protein
MPPSMICADTGSCTSTWQHLQAHLPCTCRCTKNCAGTMSSFSLTSSPTRTICRPQPTVGHVVSSGSWRCSTRRRCAGSAWRLGRRRWSLGASCGVLPCSCSNSACRLASSSAIVSSNRRRCSALIASVLAPNFQPFSRASSKLTLSSLAVLNCSSASLRSISPAWCAMRSSRCRRCCCCSRRRPNIRCASVVMASGLRPSRSASTIAFTSSMERDRAACHARRHRGICRLPRQA